MLSPSGPLAAPRPVAQGWGLGGWNVSCQRRTLKWWKETIPKKLCKTGLMDVLATDIISGVPRAKKKRKEKSVGGADGSDGVVG